MSDANERRWTAALAALDANLLVALDALLQELNVTRAARRVGITQSAMSQTLGRLRRQFDDPILVKVGRHMEPSPFALRIRGRLHRAITELAAVVQDRPSFDPATSSQRFAIATVDYLALLLTPPLRTAFAEVAPGVRLAVHALDPEAITGRLAEGTVQLYVGVRGQTERALETEALHVERLRVVLRADHLLARGPLTLERYAAAAHVHVSPRREPGSIVDRGLAELGFERTVAIEVPYFALLPDLLTSSDLIATVPARIAEYFAEQHALAVIDAPLPLPEFEVCTAWHPTFTTEPSLIWLREAVRRVLG